MATIENCKVWEKSGKYEFARLCQKLIANQDFLIEDIVMNDLKRTVYDLFWLGVRGNLKIDQILSAITDIAELHDDIPSMVADIFSVIDVELMAVEESDNRERFINIVTALQSLIPDYLLKERLDAETLENIGLIQSKVAFQQKYVKTKTKIYYKQQKFNLLREESEGYSKLTTELNQEFSDSMTHSVLLENLKSLIGCFNLDPNRVLDIILESFECRPSLTSIFIPLLHDYATDRDTLCHVLGFKFHFYQETQDCVTPASLYNAAAILLQHQLISLDLLYAHLSPSNAEILEQSKQELTDAKAYARKTTVINLADKAATNSATGGTVAAATEIKEEKDKATECRVVDNQKFGLCEALINIGAWNEAKQILDSLPPNAISTRKSLAISLCSLVSYMIEPLYIEHSGLPKLLLQKRAPVSIPATDNIKQVKTFNDLPEQVFPMLQQLGCNLATNPQLLVKVNRLAKYFLEMEKKNGEVDETSDVFGGFLTIYDEVILPSLSLMPGNCCMAEEIWTFIKLLKYEHRYRLYGQWKNESYLNHALLIRARADVLDKVKYIMRRLAKENVKPLGRQLGKLSHSGPGIVFEYILSQIQKYDNFIGPVVDSLKFLTPMAYDVLAYCVIEALANPEKERLKTDDTNISTWLQSLANFGGSIVKKYSVDIAGLLHYIANQLKAGKSYDLYVLREVVQKMAGIEVSEEITTDQLLAMSGGELLRQEGGYFTQVRNTRKSSSRLLEILREHQLAIPLCLLMAQQRNGTVFTQSGGAGHEDTRHLKLIGKLYDQCQDTVVQFVSFLGLQLSAEDIVKELPPIDELMTTYHVPADIAFALWRTVYSANISGKYDELRRADKKDKTTSSSQTAKVQRYIEAVDYVMNPIRQLVIPLSGASKNWEELSVLFYTTFWSLSMYDLLVPAASYEKLIQQHKSQQAIAEDNKDTSKRKKEKERCTQLMDRLVEEERRQQEHVKLVLARLKHEKDNWFAGKMAKHSTITAIIQHCLFPRCCFTANDAIYCARFLYVLHNLKTPNFSSLICYDRIFNDIAWALTSCAENEAHRYGRFLSAVLDDVMRWHGDRTVYEKECANYPGFVTVFRSQSATPTNIVAEHLDYENYRHVVHKWHYSITRVAVQCMESSDFLQIRNVLIILTKILTHYPKVFKLGQALERRLEKVIESQKEKRPDLYCLALAYSGQLKSSKKNWIPDMEFHKKDADAKGMVKTVNVSQSASSSSVTAGGVNSAAPAVTSGSTTTVTAPAASTDRKESKSATDKVVEKSNIVRVSVTASGTINNKTVPTINRLKDSGTSNGTSADAHLSPTTARSTKDVSPVAPNISNTASSRVGKERGVDQKKGESGGGREKKSQYPVLNSSSDGLTSEVERERGVLKQGAEEVRSIHVNRDQDLDLEPSESHASSHSHHRRSNADGGGSGGTRSDESARSTEERDVKRRKTDPTVKTPQVESRGEDRTADRGNGVRGSDSRGDQIWSDSKDGDKQREQSRDRKRLGNDKDDANFVESKRYKSEDLSPSNIPAARGAGGKITESNDARLSDRKKSRDGEKEIRIKEEVKEKEPRPRSREDDSSKKSEKTRVKVEPVMISKEKTDDRGMMRVVRVDEEKTLNVVKGLKQEESPEKEYNKRLKKSKHR